MLFELLFILKSDVLRSGLPCWFRFWREWEALNQHHEGSYRYDLEQRRLPGAQAFWFLWPTDRDRGIGSLQGCGYCSQVVEGLWRDHWAEFPDQVGRESCKLQVWSRSPFLRFASVGSTVGRIMHNMIAILVLVIIVIAITTIIADDAHHHPHRRRRCRRRSHDHNGHDCYNSS